MRSAKYVIIGGGSAGCAVANRLSEDPRNQVILVEAGGGGRGFWIDMPLGVIRLVGNPRTDWIDVTEPDPSIGNRTIIWNHGKLLGGGGAINGMVYFRGQRGDYDAWEQAGCTGWSFDDVLPYFIKNEDWRGKRAFQAHGQTGHLSVSHNRVRSALLGTFIESAQNFGLPLLDDYCDGNIHGVYPTLATQGDGRRCSPAKAYLEPARHRPNLTILTHCLVDRIVFENGRAARIVVRRRSTTFEIAAECEIVLCAGATNSPVILMRSGIGPADQLRTHGVPVLVDRKSVGQNLMDHPTISMRWLVDEPSFNSLLQSRFRLAREFYRYLVHGDGMLTVALIQAIAGVKTLSELSEPDVAMFFSSFVFDPTKPLLKPGRASIVPLLDRPAAGMTTFVNRPHSRGEIRLGGPAAHDRPKIFPGLLSDQRDVDTLMRAGRIIEQIFATPPLAQHLRGRLIPELRSDDEWRGFVRDTAGISYHTSGTCRMGSDAESVVDPALRVRGVQGLRVIDTSIMPSMVSGNTNAPAMMIGERGSAFILDEDDRNSRASRH